MSNFQDLRKVAVNFRRLMIRVQNQQPRPDVWLELERHDPKGKLLRFCTAKETFDMTIQDMSSLLDMGAEQVMKIVPKENEDKAP